MSDTIETKTTAILGNHVMDAAGEPVKERIAEDGTVIETIQTKTTSILGNPIRDAAGETVKEVIAGKT